MTDKDPQAIQKYLADVEPAKRALIEHYYARLVAIVPDAEVGTSYAMACYLYQGKGLLSVMATNAGLSVIPYSGNVGQVLRAAHGEADLDLSAKGGTIKITVERPLPDELFDEVVRLRVAELDAKAKPDA